LVYGASLSFGAVLGELGGRTPLLGTPKGRSYQYPESGWETDFGLQFDCPLIGHNPELLFAS